MRVNRVRTSFQSGGITCVGYVYRQADAESALLPCIVMAHGFGGTQEGSLKSTAEDFASAGFMVLTFDYRYLGESGGDPRQIISISGQLEDWHVAVGHARSLPGVDRARIAIWGSSLSGGHVVEVAARDDRIAAVVAQVPFNGFPSKIEGRSRAETWRLMLAIIKDWWRGATGRPPFYVPAVAPRGELAVMAFDKAADIIRSMSNETWRNEIAPRVLLEMMFSYRPGRKAHRLKMSILVCLAENDAQTPSRLGRKIADNAPLGELRRYPCTHFDFYRDSIRQTVVADQISFLETQLVMRPNYRRRADPVQTIGTSGDARPTVPVREHREAEPHDGGIVDHRPLR
ncbi:alpha/beta hydrolase fold protein [Aminobacter sp. Y103A]|nr:alpha/beta hydrolase fold protein [Aminobacter sp. SS-2016]